MTKEALINLARKGQYDALESAWMEALEANAIDVEGLLEVLDIVLKADKASHGEVLAWTALTALQEKLTAEQALSVGRELLIRASGSEDLRKEVLGLYRTVYSGHPRFARALDLSGLASGGKVRKALKTLDVCLHLEPGAYILNRFNEQAAEVIELDEGTFQVAVRTRQGTQRLGPDQIAGEYDFIDADDFRALRQLHPERVSELLEADPVRLVVGLLRGHRNRMDVEQLRHTLCPTFLANGEWSTWWGKARTKIKKSPNVLLEGRNPVVLTYDAVGRSLEEEVWPVMEKTYPAGEVLEQMEGYLREARARNQKPSDDMLSKLAGLLRDRIAQQLRHSPGEALANALICQRLGEVTTVPPGQKEAGDILAAQDDPVSLIIQLPAVALWPRALDALEERFPDTREELLVKLLEQTPMNLCDDVAGRLAAAGHPELVLDLIPRAMSDPIHHVDVLGWLWRGPELGDAVPLPSKFDLLMKLMWVLDTFKRQADAYPAELVRDARLKIRTALGSKKHQPFREAIEGIEPAMAATLRRQIERAEGLGTSVNLDLRRIIDREFPGLTVPSAERTRPWDDTNVLYATAEGFAQRERELHEIVHVKMKENAKAIGAAIEHGDLSENSEYKFALEERDLLQSRMRTIQQEMAKARILRPDEVDPSEVGIGTKVTLKAAQASGDESLSLSILGPWESDIDNGIYNYNAPLCKNLLGRKRGDSITLQLGTSERAYTIESIAVADFK